MAIFKCKMCGGTLEVGNESVAVCEYCGTQQTLPKLDDEKKANLYDRANHFRRNNEYDKAKEIYERILNEDNTDAEAYWSIVLCRYGIEYVEDPTTHKRVPTVNRAQFTSIFDDANYKAALSYADGLQKRIYEEEAKNINEIQKGILTISQKEEPFDVFICYKETDNVGRRTPDSVLANDLYHQLTQEGFKVFFSRITLEDKLGSAYEPYIFAALNSAKVMVVLGTKPEYYNAVWVKNEWSRYLSMIKNGEQKMLIPAYKDMDPYDLPDEFSHLQAQDMSKLGFMQDLIRGIKKIITVDESNTGERSEKFIASNNNIGSFLRRAFMFLEDKEWRSADEYCEKVLDIDPENAEAYLGKLMSQLKVSYQKDLSNCEEPFDNMNSYRKVIRFANSDLKEELENYVENIKKRNELRRLNSLYEYANRKYLKAKTEIEYKEAADAFRSILGWKDAQEKVEVCLEKASECLRKEEESRKDKIYNDAINFMRSTEPVVIKKAIPLFESISEWKDASEKVEEAKDRIEEMQKVCMYNEACVLMKVSDLGSINEAIQHFEKLIGWRDADKKIEECKREIEKLKEIEKAEENKRKKEYKKRKTKTVLVIMTSVLIIGATIIYAGMEKKAEAQRLLEEQNREETYNEAKKLLEDGKSGEAAAIFEELGDFKDSKDILNEIENIYQTFKESIELGDYDNSVFYWDAYCANIFAELDYKDVATYYGKKQQYESVVNDKKKAICGSYVDMEEMSNYGDYATLRLEMDSFEFNMGSFGDAGYLHWQLSYDGKMTATGQGDNFTYRFIPTEEGIKVEDDTGLALYAGEYIKQE